MLDLKMQTIDNDYAHCGNEHGLNMVIQVAVSRHGNDTLKLKLIADSEVGEE
tara:strand:+ start:474 stop:629 length:156 start_codon:yes stop_codon:yes gene_type:complete